MTIALAYGVLAVAMIRLTRFDDGLATLWVASALLMAELLIAPNPRQQWATILGCGTAMLTAGVMLNFTFFGSAQLALANIGEVMLTVILLRRFGHARTYFESAAGVGWFALSVAMAMAAVAIPTGVLLSLSLDRPWTNFAFAWFAGHGLGLVAFTPLFTLILTGEARRRLTEITARELVEGWVLLTSLLAVCVAVFSQAVYPVLYLPVLPLMIIAFRLERLGTMLGIVILAVTGTAATALGHGPSFVGENLDMHIRLLQTFLAVTVLTVLPVAGEMKHRREIMRRLRESEMRHKLITESATDMIIMLGRSGHITYASPSTLEVTGFPPEDLLGLHPHDHPSGPDRETMALASEQSRTLRDKPSIVEYRAYTADGTLRWFEAHTRTTFDAEGHVSGWVTAVRDISARKALEQRLAHAATTDPLTGLANRRKFDAIIDRKIAAAANGTVQGCVALFDIDFFKRVNDEFGHAVGDLVLETFARAAQRCVRAGDQVARLGGEEFGLILDGATLDQAARVCERVREEVAQAITTTPTGAAVRVTVSAGIAPISAEQGRVQLMRAADEALYRAKAGGRDRLAFAA
ncbi:sensor domain-containing diguanylate cyclase [Sphingomonas sp.]|uniref:sensor domain-containing diguanylate cyclase n=1 Tax=Sphingomonas sp. TaxID=28214 RepID=UPI001DE07940|nr:sensor domain-containing diguanylate cyclase [Sphingomonas sp.]MBX9796034.1 diguanylate cyclase [Sphingomonas sp.]